jgi:hypothetical protein
MIARIRQPIILGALLLGATALPAVALAQTDNRVPTPVKRIKLSGPRFGITYLGGSIVDSLAAYDVDVSPVITQFGWQFERMLFAGNDGLSAVTEWVLLVGGLEQSAFIPSVSWLVGVRGPSGAEFGVGPNVSPAGSALAIAAGVTTRAGAFNLPVNIAVVPGKIGTRVSVLVGFTTRSEPSWSSDVAPRVPTVRRPSRPRLPPFPLPGAPIPRCCRASS